jgi:hypothetical protein
MSPGDILASLAKRGVSIKAEGSNLVFDAPVGEMKPDDLALLRSNKAALLSYLRPVRSYTAPGCPKWVFDDRLTISLSEIRALIGSLAKTT